MPSAYNVYIFICMYTCRLYVYHMCRLRNLFTCRDLLSHFPNEHSNTQHDANQLRAAFISNV